MADRLEALTAILNAARALRQSGMADVRLDQLYATLDAHDAVDGAPAPPMRAPGLCTNPECWQYRWEGGAYCFTHREEAAALPSLRRRAPELSGGDDGG